MSVKNQLIQRIVAPWIASSSSNSVMSSSLAFVNTLCDVVCIVLPVVITLNPAAANLSFFVAMAGLVGVSLRIVVRRRNAARAAELEAEITHLRTELEKTKAATDFNTAASILSMTGGRPLGPPL